MPLPDAEATAPSGSAELIAAYLNKQGLPLTNANHALALKANAENPGTIAGLRNMEPISSPGDPGQPPAPGRGAAGGGSRGSRETSGRNRDPAAPAKSKDERDDPSAPPAATDGGSGLSNALLYGLPLAALGAGGGAAAYGLTRPPAGGGIPPEPPSGAPAIDPNGQMMAKALQDRVDQRGGWEKYLGDRGAPGPQPGSGADLGIPAPGPTMQRGAPGSVRNLRPDGPPVPVSSTGLNTVPDAARRPEVTADIRPRGGAPAEPVPMAPPPAAVPPTQQQGYLDTIAQLMKRFGIGGAPGSAGVRPPKPMMPRA